MFICELLVQITTDTKLFSPASWKLSIVTRTGSYLQTQAGIQQVTSSLVPMLHFVLVSKSGFVGFVKKLGMGISYDINKFKLVFS